MTPSRAQPGVEGSANRTGRTRAKIAAVPWDGPDMPGQRRGPLPAPWPHSQQQWLPCHQMATPTGNGIRRTLRLKPANISQIFLTKRCLGAYNHPKPTHWQWQAAPLPHVAYLHPGRKAWYRVGLAWCWWPRALLPRYPLVLVFQHSPSIPAHRSAPHFTCSVRSTTGEYLWCKQSSLLHRMSTGSCVRDWTHWPDLLWLTIPVMCNLL